MELILKSPSLIKKSMEIISEIVLEGTLVAKKDSLEIVALNSNNVVMIIFKLLNTDKNFDKYEIEEEQKITINFEHFSDSLKRCSDSEALKLSLEGNKFKIVSLGKNQKEFDLSLIDYIDENLQKIPNLEFPAQLVMKSSAFSEAINDLSFLEEGVDFIINKEIFSIEGKTPTRTGKVDFKENIDIENKSDDEIKSKYSIEYLKKFIKGEKINKNVQLSFNNDYPLKIEYKITDQILLGFILAPRGED